MSKLELAIENLSELKPIKIEGKLLDLRTYETSNLLMVDTIELMRDLREYEIDMTSEDFHNLDGEVEDLYTYNFSSRLNHDLMYTVVECEDDTVYVRMKAHRYGDVRINFTNEFYLKFDDMEDLRDTLYREYQNVEFEITVDNIEYIISMGILDEEATVYVKEGYQKACCIFGVEDEEIIEEIRAIKLGLTKE